MSIHSLILRRQSCNYAYGFTIQCVCFYPDDKVKYISMINLYKLVEIFLKIKKKHHHGLFANN